MENSIIDKQVLKLFLVLKNCKSVKSLYIAVQKSNIYKDHIEAIFNVVIDFLKDIKNLKFKSQISESEL